MEQLSDRSIYQPWIIAKEAADEKQQMTSVEEQGSITVMTKLDPALIDQFQMDGVAVLRDVISPEWIATLRAGLDANIAAPGPHRRNYTKDGDSGHFFGDYVNWPRIQEYRDFAFKSPIGGIAASLMGSEKANLFHEHVVVKEPSTGDRTPWHHDQPYYCVDGNDSVSIWIPLDPVPQETAVEFIKGSHKWDRWFTPTKFTGVDYDRDDTGFETIPDIQSDRGNYDIVSHGLEVGDCVAFHFRTVHGAPGNSSSTVRRRAISFRFTGDDARFVIRDGEMSPPFLAFDALTLKPGDVMDSDLFPVVYPAAVIDQNASGSDG